MRIGIICAIKNELRYFNTSKNTCQKIGDRTFYNGIYENHELILVQSGLGKVNAAVVSTLLIDKFNCELLLFSGVAGGIDPDMEIGDVIIAESLIQYDYGTLLKRELKAFRPGSIPIGEPKNELEFSLDTEIKNKIKAVLPQIRMGTILTGDVFLQCEETRIELFEKYGAQAIDMEGGAVAQVAEQYGIPVIVIRSLSDLAAADSQKLSSKYLKKAAENSFNTVQDLLKAL